MQIKNTQNCLGVFALRSMCALKEINYDGFLTLEVDYNIKTVSNEFIKRTYEQVVMLYKMLKKGE